MHLSAPHAVKTCTRAHFNSQKWSGDKTFTHSSVPSYIRALGLWIFRFFRTMFPNFFLLANSCSIHPRRVLHARPKGYILRVIANLKARIIILSYSKNQNHIERFSSSPKLHQVVALNFFSLEFLSSTHLKQIHLKEVFKVVGSSMVKMYGEQSTSLYSPYVELQLGNGCEFPCNSQNYLVLGYLLSQIIRPVAFFRVGFSTYTSCLLSLWLFAFN